MVRSLVLFSSAGCRCHTMSIFFAQDFRHIAPPVDYSFIPIWLVFLVTFVGLALIGLAIWWLKGKFKRAAPPKLPRERALEALEDIGDLIETENPYRFSIKVSDILRRFVTEQYNLPLTRQTSVEFLEALASNPAFSGEDKILLRDFLNRCDLIKFARYDATPEDSRQLLDEAMRFVKGGEVVTVAS
jgi:Domain of unknown function (DUF4381)